MKLKELFSNGATPDPSELEGFYEVRLAIPFLPEIRFFGHRKFFPEDVSLDQGGHGGYNEFLGKIRIGNFKTGIRESVLGDGQRVLHINYNRPGNCIILKALNDELKRIEDGRYLGRGVFKIGRRAFNSFYFSVKKSPLSPGGGMNT